MMCTKFVCRRAQFGDKTVSAFGGQGQTESGNKLHWGLTLMFGDTWSLCTAGLGTKIMVALTSLQRLVGTMTLSEDWLTLDDAWSSSQNIIAIDSCSVFLVLRVNDP